MSESTKSRAPRNRTITLSDEEAQVYKLRLAQLQSPATLAEVQDKTIRQDMLHALRHFPANSVDLLFADPPYNLSKTFHERRFQETSLAEYEEWLDSWLGQTVKLLKPSASVYICGDWRSSAAIHRIGAKYFAVRNRITWEREKGRGAKANWKNCSEDIWFFTLSDEYTFNVDAVMLKRQVVAPYTDENGAPKDWADSQDGRFRLTHPSNLWTDMTIPFWSMPENTDHPTQKPEKLLAKIILASSREGDLILDPFLGSGTTSVVAKKLRRHYVGIEIDEKFCCLAEKRLAMVAGDSSIQGYSDGVFWERNTLALQSKEKERATRTSSTVQPSLL
ncbi:MAG: DNA-methyltransferase [Pyrinomonadaceae bacterium]